MIEIVEATIEPELAAIRELFVEYREWTLKSLEGAEDAPTFTGHQAEFESLPGPYAPPGGRLLLGRVEGQPAGCVAYREHAPGEVELKRLYVRPQFRGQKIGHQLVTTLLEKARAAGAAKVVLSSHANMTSAHAIYRAAGFRDIPAPDDFPAAQLPLTVFMEREV